MPDAELSPEEEKTSKKLVAILVAIAVVLSGGFLIQHFLFGVYSVATGSMEPTYHGCKTNGDGKCTRLLVFKGATQPVRGDVIVFTAPNDKWGGHVVLTKRVIATAGQRVSCDNSRGLTGVLVDGEQIPEPYLNRQWLSEKYGDKLSMSDGSISPCYGPGWGSVVVPDHSVFVLGDNRGDSQDSRAFVKSDAPEDFGYAVPLSNMIGTVVFSWG